MIRHTLNYRWENGIPRGFQPVEDERACVLTFRVLSDPYGKRFVVEQYRFGNFEAVLYDSRFLDFRKLKPEHQRAWRQSLVRQDDRESLFIIRDEDDIATYYERHFFEKGLCRRCDITSPQGVLLCRHKLYYETEGDAFSGVVLYDVTDRPVLKKIYKSDASGQFLELLSEIGNL